MQAQIHESVLYSSQLVNTNSHPTGPMNPIMRAATSKAKVIRLGYDVKWFDYSIGHQVCLEEIEQILPFFQEMF